MKNISKVLLFVITAYSCGVFSAKASQSFSNPDIAISVTKFGVELGKSKIIYHQNGRGEVLTISNPRDYPVLVQTSVFDSFKKKSNDFIVTPPLFRLDPKETNSLQIIHSNGSFPGNKESLNWICVKGIPPKGGELWDDKIGIERKNKVNVRMLVAVDNCIKLIYRPETVQGDPVDLGGNLKWHVVGRKLIVDNPTPFVMSITNLKMNGVAMSGGYVNPMSSTSFDLPNTISSHGKLTWAIVGDLGNISSDWSSIVS